MIMKKKLHGGKRIGSGRKPVDDKKVMVGIYPNQSRVDILGIEHLKDTALSAIEKEYKKMKKS